MMCYNLYYLANVFSVDNWKHQAEAMVEAMGKMILQYPSSFSYWAQSYYVMTLGFTEIISIGSNVKKSIFDIQSLFQPFKMMLISDQFDPGIPLLKGKEVYDNQYFMCNRGNCAAPVSNLNDFLTTINQVNY